MRKKLAALAMLAFGIAVTAYLATAKQKPQPGDAPPPPLPQVAFIVAQPAPATITVNTQGTVQPFKEIDLVSRVAGTVVETHPNFAAGAYFQQSDQLLRIEDADYRFALTRTEAQVAQARELLATERARAAQAKKEWHELGHPDANALFLREPQLTSARAALQAAEADWNQAQVNLQRTRINTPFAGGILEKHVDTGQYVTPGTLIARLFATDAVEVRLPLTSQQAALIELPFGFVHNTISYPAVTLHYSFAGRIHRWQGQLVRTEARVDIDSRVTYVIARVTDPFVIDTGHSLPLSLGLFVEADIEGKTFEHVVTLPRQALQVDRQLLSVDEQDTLHFKPVQVLRADRDQVLVTGDFRPGERIVVSNLPMAVEGLRVMPVPAPAKTPAAAQP